MYENRISMHSFNIACNIYVIFKYDFPGCSFTFFLNSAFYYGYLVYFRKYQRYSTASYPHYVSYYRNLPAIDSLLFELTGNSLLYQLTSISLLDEPTNNSQLYVLTSNSLLYELTSNSQLYELANNSLL